MSPDDLDQIRAFVAAFEKIVRAPGYQAHAFAGAPVIALLEPHQAGVFFGFDFHLTEDGPRLIEVNSNAGGAVLNLSLLEAQRPCCDEVVPLMTRTCGDAVFRSWIDMFIAEAGGTLSHLAIVDDQPQTQYLYPEFVLLKAKLEAAGIRVSIAAPESIDWRKGGAVIGGCPVDLIYNRLTDFYLEDEGHQALRQAYEEGRLKLTPHPRAFALYADKGNLPFLSSSALDAIGVLNAEELAFVRNVVPRTVRVEADNADELWHRRNTLFFKPARGFGSRAAYRGDKLTRKVWQDILTGDYIAQDLVPPSRRRVGNGGKSLKFDIRAYTYCGEVQLVAARLYEGQTTNFRTEDGGFAPVFAPAILRQPIQSAQCPDSTEALT